MLYQLITWCVLCIVWFLFSVFFFFVYGVYYVSHCVSWCVLFGLPRVFCLLIIFVFFYIYLVRASFWSWNPHRLAVFYIKRTHPTVATAYTEVREPYRYPSQLIPNGRSCGRNEMKRSDRYLDMALSGQNDQTSMGCEIGWADEKGGQRIIRKAGRITGEDGTRLTRQSRNSSLPEARRKRLVTLKVLRMRLNECYLWTQK